MAISFGSFGTDPGGSTTKQVIPASNSLSNSVAIQNSASNSGSVSQPNVYLSSLFRDIYGNYLNQNRAEYANYINSYGGVLGQLFGTPASGGQAATPGLANQIVGGYAALNADVQDSLKGAERSRTRDIGEAYQRSGDQARQNLISSGLGNTTVQLAAQRGNEADKQKALQSLSDEYAQMRTGYQSQFGQGALNAQQQAMQDAASLGGQYMSGHANYGQAMPTWAPNETRSNATSSSNSTSTSNAASHTGANVTTTTTGAPITGGTSTSTTDNINLGASGTTPGVGYGPLTGITAAQIRQQFHI